MYPNIYHSCLSDPSNYYNWVQIGDLKCLKTTVYQLLTSQVSKMNAKATLMTQHSSKYFIFPDQLL